MKVSKPLLSALYATLIALAIFSAPTVLMADDIVYTLDQSIPFGSVTGTITTDGTLGTLNSTDIVGWDLIATDGSNSQTLTPLDSLVTGSGTDLTATSTALTLDFSNANYGYLSFAAISPGTGYASWVAGYVPGGYGYISANNTDYLELEAIGYESGSQVIAVATPEPASSSLMLIGVAFLFAMRKRIGGSLPQAS